MAWSGSELGLTWEDEIGAVWDIYFQRVDASGSPIGTAINVSDSAISERDPDVAWSGQYYGLVWLGDGDIHFARVDANGSRIGGPVTITNAPGTSSFPTIVWTGHHYLVAWDDDRTGTGGVFATLIDENGSEVGDDVELSTSSGTTLRPFVEWTGAEAAAVWIDTRDGNEEIYFKQFRL